jgi:hypothetical protein
MTAALKALRICVQQSRKERALEDQIEYGGLFSLEKRAWNRWRFCQNFSFDPT